MKRLLANNSSIIKEIYKIIPKYIDFQYDIESDDFITLSFTLNDDFKSTIGEMINDYFVLNISIKEYDSIFIADISRIADKYGYEVSATVEKTKYNNVVVKLVKIK